MDWMQTYYYDWGYQVIGALQGWQNKALDFLAIGVSALGVKEFYLLAIPLVYWCISKELGARLCFVFLMGIFVNTWAKNFVHTTRPDPSHVRVLFAESGGSYSFPSGHAQGSVAFWGYAIAWVRKLGFSVFGCLLIVAMCWSRMYLGLHFPLDVFGGAALGFGTLLIFFALLDVYEKIKNKVPWTLWFAVVVISSISLAYLFPEKRYSLILGGFLGFFGGLILEERFIGFTMHKKMGIALAKAAIGIAGGAAVLLGVPAVLGRPSWALFLTYALAGAWTSFLAPACFKKTGLG